MANEGSTPNVAYYRFHFYDGKAPVQVLAGSRQAAEDFVRFRYGAEFTFAGAGSKLPGYIDQTAGTSGADDTGGSTEVQELFPEEAYQAGLKGAGLNPKGAFGGILRNRFD